MTGHIHATRNLWLTPDEVWAMVTDLPNWGKWLPLHQSWVKNPPVLTPGANLTSKITVLGVPTTMTWHVGVMDPRSRLVLTGTGAAGVRCRFEFTITPTRDGTEFAMKGDFRGELIQGVVGDAMENDVNRQLSSALRRLDALSAPHHHRELAATA
jgi:carbon monoxide dehydrogenase subunit G